MILRDEGIPPDVAPEYEEPNSSDVENGNSRTHL